MSGAVPHHRDMDNHPEQTVPRKLHRRSTDRLLGGVAGGLGDYTGIDPVWYRIAFIFLALIGGAGILFYALAWLLVPEENATQPLGMTMIERLRGRRWLALGLITAATIIVLIQFNITELDWGRLLPIALVAIGFVLLRDDPANRSTMAASDQAVTDPTGRRLPRVQLRRQRRPRSPLGLLTLGATCAVVAVTTIATATGVVSLDLGQYAALAILTIGGGLVVGGWWGRARYLALIAALLVPLMVVGSIVDVPFRGEITGKYVGLERPIEDRFELLLGTMSLDFGSYEFDDTPTIVDVSFYAGNVDVFVPPGVEVVVKGEMDAGVADLFGEGYEGADHEFNGTYVRKGLTEGTLILNVDGGVGSFDATWAYWVNHNIKRKQRRRERLERINERLEKKIDRRIERRRERNRG